VKLRPYGKAIRGGLIKSQENFIKTKMAGTSPAMKMLNRCG